MNECMSWSWLVLCWVWKKGVWDDRILGSLKDALSTLTDTKEEAKVEEEAKWVRKNEEWEEKDGGSAVGLYGWLAPVQIWQILSRGPDLFLSDSRAPLWVYTLFV